MAKFMKSLNNISRCQSLYRTEKLQAEGICACHHAFILCISRNPGRSQEELARELCLNKSTVARALIHLEKYGYITRNENPCDKRQFLVFPTEKLEKILPDVRRTAKEWNESIVAGIDEKELEIFHSVLDRIEKTAKAKISEI